ncbi:VWA domain-containing protein [Streptomyces sp. SPB162]|uniref:vWA domain-containing protein n=1 Tax=Streptomyces sp. SPB162 TaxID=2940560 RepID=UPI0024059499|nr:VWA domain-containing protein [Streptomyces sp. SPB162]MDF9814397.1 Ca-activated chloride channel family protein [Streptomyces sp. SPB162]
MQRPQWRAAVGAVGGGVLLTALAALGGPAAARAAEPAADDSLIMVLDSSGSMAGPDGSGSTRIESARKAVSTVVETLPDGHRTGLRVYGAGKPHGCDDTQLSQAVVPLDRDAMKRAVAAVQPKGDTPTALALTRAAGDLPKGGRRTILLISDGESNCGAPKPCEVAAQLAGDGIGLRIDTVGFQVKGAAREELECVARAGHGAYYDAPDAAALARQLVRASQLSADGYRFEGTRITGGPTAARAAGIAPGQYLDTIGSGETRWYAAGLDATSTADLAVTAVPQPGVKVGYGDGIELKAVSGGQYAFTCDTGSAHFGQDEGAMIVSAAVSRVPTAKGDGSCDKAGRYLLSVHRTSAPGSDQGRWPVELRYGSEPALKAGTTPAAAETAYGDKPAPLAGDPRDITGGTGFNDATALTKGVWRDKLLPAQTRFYKVRLGWGQQLGYTAEFANEPVLDDASAASVWSFVETGTYGPGRQPVRDASGGDDHRSYTGKPLSVGLGTVPVTWTNRWVLGGSAPAVHSAGDYYIAVSLGPRAARLAKNAAVGVVLRVNVTGDELAGPQYQAPALAKGQARNDGGDNGGQDDGKAGDKGGDSAAGRDSGGSNGGGFMTGKDMIAAGAGGAVALAAVGGVALVRRTKRGGA